MSHPRMISSRIFFQRMNEHRNNNWLSEARLLKGCEEFFGANQYNEISFNKTFDQGRQTFQSPISASRNNDGYSHTIVTLLKPEIIQYDLKFFGRLESLVFEVMDNYQDSNLMLVTDSLSYNPIVNIEQINTTIKNLMDEGMYILFVNNRLAYAMFDTYDNITRPIPVHD